MRVVRYVGAGEDERHLLVETVEGDEKFTLYITDDLRRAASIDLPRLTQVPVDNPVSPREIQMRVRAGESPEEIAEQSGMSMNRVMRFAAAVVQERERITGEARAARARRNSPDGEFVIFGEHVDARFTAHGIDPTSVSWDSHRNDEGVWVISAGWHGGDLKRVARWGFTLSNRSVTPMDDTAADLLSDRPIRPVVHVVYDMPIANPADSPTGPIPIPGSPRDQLFDQSAKHSIVNDYVAGHEADPSDSTDSDENQDSDETRFDTASILPLRGLPEPSIVPGMEESDDEHAARARIPSWDDILLGVRRKRD